MFLRKKYRYNNILYVCVYVEVQHIGGAGKSDSLCLISEKIYKHKASKYKKLWKSTKIQGSKVVVF